MDMFEPQDHPDDIPYPGGAAAAALRRHRLQPRLLDGHQVRPHSRRRSTARSRSCADVVPPPPGTVTQAPSGGGYLLSHQVNDAFVAVNRLLKANEEVYWLKSPSTVNGQVLSGRHDVHSGEADDAADPAEGGRGQGPERSTRSRRRPPATMTKLRPVRIGLWDIYGGSMPSGWTRWLLEQFEFPFEVVFPKTLDAGNLARQVRRADFRGRRDPGARRRRRRISRSAGDDSRRVPRLAGQRHRGADRSRAEEVRRGRRHAAGDRLVDRARASPRPADSRARWSNGSTAARAPLPRREVLRARVDSRGARRQHASARLRPRRTVDVFFDHSEAFRLLPEAALQGREGGGLDRQPRAASERLGLGTAVSRSGGRRSSRRRSARGASCCSVRRLAGARSRTAHSNSCSTAIYYGSGR